MWVWAWLPVPAWLPEAYGSEEGVLGKSDQAFKHSLSHSLSPHTDARGYHQPLGCGSVISASFLSKVWDLDVFRMVAWDDKPSPSRKEYFSCWAQGLNVMGHSQGYLETGTLMRQTHCMCMYLYPPCPSKHLALAFSCIERTIQILPLATQFAWCLVPSISLSLFNFLGLQAVLQTYQISSWLWDLNQDLPSPWNVLSLYPIPLF